MHAQTVYRTNKPESPARRDSPEDFSDVEYYQLSISEKHDENDILKPTLQVFHGWWDEKDKSPKNNLLILSTHYDSLEEAYKAYDEQLAHYAKLGYVHSFTLDPFAANGLSYSKLAD